MGDLISLIASFNLSPLITILLCALGFALRNIFTRIEALETVATRNAKSSAYIKGRLGFTEEDD